MQELRKPPLVALLATFAVAIIYLIILLTNEYWLNSHRFLGVNYNMLAAAAIPVMLVSAVVARKPSKPKSPERKLANIGIAIPMFLLLMLVLAVISNTFFPSGD